MCKEIREDEWARSKIRFLIDQIFWKIILYVNFVSQIKKNWKKWPYLKIRNCAIRLEGNLNFSSRWTRACLVWLAEWNKIPSGNLNHRPSYPCPNLSTFQHRRHREKRSGERARGREGEREEREKPRVSLNKLGEKEKGGEARVKEGKWRSIVGVTKIWRDKVKQGGGR